MTQGYQIKDQEAAYYLTLQVVEWADIFSRQIYRDIIIDSFRFCQQNKGLEIYAYVIMTNHIHLLAKTINANLSDVLRDLKRHTSKKIIETIDATDESRRKWLKMVFGYAARQHQRNNEYQVWTHENHAIEIYSNNLIEQKINYIHNNPVRAGIVEKAEDYLYSSARNYSEKDSLIDICKISMRWKNIK